MDTRGGRRTVLVGFQLENSNPFITTVEIYASISVHLRIRFSWCRLFRVTDWIGWFTQFLLKLSKTLKNVAVKIGSHGYHHQTWDTRVAETLKRDVRNKKFISEKWERLLCVTNVKIHDVEPLARRNTWSPELHFHFPALVLLESWTPLPLCFPTPHNEERDNLLMVLFCLFYIGFNMCFVPAIRVQLKIGS